MKNSQIFLDIQDNKLRKKQISGKQCDQWLTSLVQEHQTPLAILDCNKVTQNYTKLKNHLPNVELFYAIKAFSDVNVISALSNMGASFDFSSLGEIELANSLKLKKHNKIYTHPCKKIAEIKQAVEQGFELFIIDNELELEKFVGIQNVKLLLRVAFDSDYSIVNLSKKFGCDPAQSLSLIQRANDLGLKLNGVSFHVGSQCMDSSIYNTAIDFSLSLAQQVELLGLPKFEIINIGGGFPVDYPHTGGINEEEYFSQIRESLVHIPSDIKIYAEPGRYIVADSVTLITSIVGKAMRQGKMCYYLDDGVYGTYSGHVYDKAIYPFRAIKKLNSEKTGKIYKSTLYGPTCDSFDCIEEEVEMEELFIDDLLVSEMMGAYTLASSTHFNLVPQAKVLVIRDTET